YPPDEYLHPYEPLQRYQVDSNDVQYIEPYEKPKPVITEVDASLDQNDTSVPNRIPIPTGPSSSIPSMASPTPQDRWSKDKHIKLINIIGNPGAGMLTRAITKELSAASAHECLFVDFLSEEEPKKVSEALKHPRWVDVMQ
ncbi:hypothetical protein Tco_0182425, partial [Tanacetum coccineum]